MKVLVVLAAVIMVMIAGTAGFLLGVNQSADPKIKKQPLAYALSEDVEKIVGAKMKLLQAAASSPAVIQGVTKSNSENSGVTQPIINQRDQSWRHSKGVDASIKPYLTNSVAGELVKFQDNFPGFTELFVADAHGLNVGMTNKTSDYFQGDEDWWKQSYADGKGKAFHGEIEFDESSQSEAIALYQPIFDPKSHKAIGVLKALLDINAIKAEL